LIAEQANVKSVLVKARVCFYCFGSVDFIMCRGTSTQWMVLSIS
jgi:hypothetical protein